MMSRFAPELTVVFLGFSLAYLPAEPAVGQELPDADDLIAAYVEAIGGREAHASSTSIRTRGILEMAAVGIEGEFELLQIPDVGSRMRSVLPGMGEMRVGFDGEVGWSMNQVAGPELMEEEEMEQIRERTLLAATLRDPEVVPERETLEEVRMDDRPCYRVRLIWASGRETHDCYSTADGLLLRSEELQVTSMGRVPTTTEFSDYREFSGLILPTRIVQETMGMRQVMRIREVILDDADPRELEPPAEVRVLLEGG